ncbi:MAG: response regulator [Gammaproteobacteria bacterium]
MDALPGDKISVLLVDDHALVREGIARLLADAEDISIIGQFASGEEMIEFARNSPEKLPDIIILDARMPGIGGIETTRQLLNMAPGTKIIGISTVSSGVIPSQMLRSGAQGFITKSIEVEELHKAIRMVYLGQHYVSADAATQLAVDPFNQRGQSLFDKLSRRELQIAQMLTDGKKVSQISGYLDLSPKTVYSYRYRIFEKLGIRSDVELTILAVRHGLADDTRELDELQQLERFAG